MHDYLNSVYDVYKKAAISPNIGLCCTTTPQWSFPELVIPEKMKQMNYGCGSTVHPRDLAGRPVVLYVGVGGGMELLQFSYFTRRNASIIGVDLVDEMLIACQENLKNAEPENSWFKNSFVNLKKGNALELPIDDNSVDVAAQNCLFNVFNEADLRRALSEMYRVLKPHGRLILSDPICETPIPDSLRNDENLRALCLSGAISLSDYTNLLAQTGFGTIEIRARRPYRILDPLHYETNSQIYIESVEVCAIKDPIPLDGPCIFTGKTAIYFGDKEFYDDGNGHILFQNQPLSVCDKTAAKLKATNAKIFISDPTWFYDGGGCC